MKNFNEENMKFIKKKVNKKKQKKKRRKKRTQIRTKKENNSSNPSKQVKICENFAALAIKAKNYFKLEFIKSSAV